MRDFVRYTNVGRNSGENRGKEDESGIYDHIVRNTGVFGGVQWLVTLVTVIRTKIVAALLGTAGFGINESFNRTLDLVKSTSDLGIPFSAVRSISEHFEKGDGGMLERSILVTRSWAFITGAFGMLLCILLSHLFSLWAFDGDIGYTLSFVLLSPVVAFSAVTGGEMAVLKGMRRLRELALTQLISVVMLLLISVPVFYFLRLRGLVISLVLVSFSTMVVTCFFSFHNCPYRISVFNRDVLRDGSDMVRIGVFFTLAAFFGSGAFSVVANFLMSKGNAETVGAYSAGYALVNYLGMLVFSAMESDYFPRISASAAMDHSQTDMLMNKQIEVAVLLMTPAIAGFLVMLEPIVRLLLTEKFLMAVPMAQLAVLSLFFKSVSQPMAYISLAKGDSRTYLLQEVSFDVILVVLVVLCFKNGGLEMVGLAMAAAELLGLAVNWTVIRFRYGLGLMPQTLKLILIHFWPMLASYFIVAFMDGIWKWIAAAVVLAISALLSYTGLKRRTSFLDVLKRNFFKREAE